MNKNKGLIRGKDLVWIFIIRRDLMGNDTNDIP